MSIVLKGKFIISWILDLMEELSGMKRLLQPRDWSVWPSVSLITVVRTDANYVFVMDCVECHASGKHWTLKFSSAMIINHRPEKECPELPDPDNGQVHLSGRNFQVFIHVSECYFIKTFQNMIQITLGLDQRSCIHRTKQFTLVTRATRWWGRAREFVRPVVSGQETLQSANTVPGDQISDIRHLNTWLFQWFTFSLLLRISSNYWQCQSQWSRGAVLLWSWHWVVLSVFLWLQTTPGASESQINILWTIFLLLWSADWKQASFRHSFTESRL